MNELKAILIYELLPDKGFRGGQVVGADGSGTKAIVYTGDGETITNEIRLVLREVMAKGRLGMCQVVWNEEEYAGKPIQFVHCEPK